MSTLTDPRTARQAPQADHGPAGPRVGSGTLDPRLMLRSLPDAVRKLNPRVMVKSPVMFVVLIGSVLTTVLAALDPGNWFGWAITGWLWLTTLFAEGWASVRS
ncbi:hypothetical protein LUR56_20250 [Streptomyces sp. MT29]|nr:hypothetical protein [Streptomyces sp. MT29]